MEGSHPSGVLIAGGENGDVILYDPAKIIAGDSDVIITQSDKHTGPVRALDVNSFQVCSVPDQRQTHRALVDLVLLIFNKSYS